MARRGPLGSLGVRLVLAFVGAAVGALALLSVLVLLAAQGDVSHLVGDEQKATVAGVAHAAADAYTAAGGWQAADLAPAVILAEQQAASVVVMDTGGRQLAASSTRFQPTSGVVRRGAIVVAGRAVGQVVLRFSQSGLPSPERRLRDALVRTVAASAGLAALLALGVAVEVSRRITRPVMALTAAARAMGRGDRVGPVADGSAPGELGELAVAFDGMAEAVARQDALRRAVIADVAHELVPRSPSCRDLSRPSPTGWPSPVQPNCHHCAKRCCGSVAPSMTWRRCPPPKRPGCACSTIAWTLPRWWTRRQRNWPHSSSRPAFASTCGCILPLFSAIPTASTRLRPTC
jgi:hypothetical protein